MHRNPALRLLHAFWAILFLLNAAGEATLAHGYSHHGGSDVAIGAVEMAADAGHSGGHHAAGHHESAPSEDQVPSGHADQCTCAFFCGASSNLASSAEAPANIDLAFELDTPSDVLPARTPPVRRPIPHFIAYPNGPPALI